MQINYKINNHNHKIYIKRDILKNIYNDLVHLETDRKILFIYDPNIEKKFIRKIKDNLKILNNKFYLMPLKGLKSSKNEKVLFKIINFLINEEFTKKSVIISCCGGVIGDLSGLAASLYLRGLYYFHIPTTMTSIVDSCIGGKTAINYRNIINSIGTYYHPKSVFISEEIISSMPEREYLAGIPEIAKCGLIHKNNIFKTLLKKDVDVKKKKFKVVAKLVASCLKTKIHFIKDDVNEAKKRLCLNFGHTFAHSFEMTTQKLFKKEVLRHGEAVGIGMLAEIFYANKKKNKFYKSLEKILELYNLPTQINCSKSIKPKVQSEIYKNIFLDKKKIGSTPRYINLKKKGFPKIDMLENDTLINETIFSHIE